MLPYKEPLPKLLEQNRCVAFINHRSDSGQMVGSHWHSSYELLYVFDGQTTQKVNSFETQMQQGDVLLIAPGDIHSTVAISDGCFVSVTQFFHKDSVASYFLKRSSHTKELARIFSQINEEGTLRQPGFSFIAQGLVLQVLGYLLREGTLISSHLPTSSQEALKMEEYVYSRLSDNLTLQAAAEYAGYSPTYFSKYFQKMMGVPFKAYVDQVKITAAKNMLLEGMTVTQAAFELGYETPSSFCRAFKRIAGSSPTAFQNHMMSQK